MMGKVAFGRRGQGSPCQVLCARHVSRGCIGHIVPNTRREGYRQPALCVDKPWIEGQRLLEQTDLLRADLARRRFGHCHAAPEIIIQSVRALGWPTGLRADKLAAECNGDPARDLVLKGEQGACIAIEPLCQDARRLPHRSVGH